MDQRSRLLGRLAVCCALWGLLIGCSGTADGVGAASVESGGSPVPGLVQIPGGAFTYGAGEKEIQSFVTGSMVNFPGMVERIRASFVAPPREVTLSTYAIGAFEVTNEEYREFVLATGYVPEDRKSYLSHWEGSVVPEWAKDFPVVWVGRADATAYCAWRGGRLPTEEEWEKSARGTDARAFPWGSRPPRPDTTNIGTNKAEPTGNRPLDVSPYQIYDLGGNVREFTASSAQREGKDFAVLRGGSFRTRTRETLVTYRELSSTPEARKEDLGFRCAADVSADGATPTSGTN